MAFLQISQVGFDLEDLGILTKTVEKSNLLEAAISVLAGMFFWKYSLGPDLGSMCWDMNMLLQVLVVKKRHLLPYFNIGSIVSRTCAWHSQPLYVSIQMSTNAEHKTVTLLVFACFGFKSLNTLPVVFWVWVYKYTHLHSQNDACSQKKVLEMWQGKI